MAIIYATDWNPVIQKMRQVLSTPDGTTNDLGYNTTYSASDVAANQVITGAQWNNLRADVNKAYTLQTGSASNLTTRNTTTTISSADLTTISNRVDTAYNNRGAVDTGQLNTSAIVAWSYSSNWSSSLNPTGTISWANNSVYRGFWNGGGRLVFTFYRTGGDATSQNQSWTNLCSNAGSIIFTRTSMFQSGQTWNGTFSNSWNLGAYGSPRTPGSYSEAFRIIGQDTNYTSNAIYIYLQHSNTNIKSDQYLYWSVYFGDSHSALGAGPDNVNGTIGVNITAYYPFGNNPTA